MSRTKSKRFKVTINQLHKAAPIDALAQAIARAFEKANESGNVRPASDPKPLNKRRQADGNSGKRSLEWLKTKALRRTCIGNHNTNFTQEQDYGGVHEEEVERAVQDKHSGGKGSIAPGGQTPCH